MAGTKYFKAEVEREGEWWTLRIPELGNLSAQAKRLLDAEDGVRKAIAGRLGIGAGPRVREGTYGSAKRGQLSNDTLDRPASAFRFNRAVGGA
jgi:hypothetical protein